MGVIVNTPKELNFYKYITKRKDNTFLLKKDNVVYGIYHNIRDALHDRDILIDCDWDMGEMNARDEMPNRYENIKLPPSRRYISFDRTSGKYMIRKVIDGKQVFFGKYLTFNEAVKKRDELEANGWVK